MLLLHVHGAPAGRREGVLLDVEHPHDVRHHLVPAAGPGRRHETVLVERLDRPDLGRQQAEPEAASEVHLVGDVPLITVPGLERLVRIPPPDHDVGARDPVCLPLLPKPAGRHLALTVDLVPRRLPGPVVPVPLAAELVDFQGLPRAAIEDADGEVVVHPVSLAEHLEPPAEVGEMAHGGVRIGREACERAGEVLPMHPVRVDVQTTEGVGRAGVHGDDRLLHGLGKLAGRRCGTEIGPRHEEDGDREGGEHRQRCERDASGLPERAATLRALRRLVILRGQRCADGVDGEVVGVGERLEGGRGGAL